MPKVNQAQSTPNPNALKFVLEEDVGDSFQINSPDDAEGNELGAKLIEIEGVDSVFGTSNFITVNKEQDASWSDLRDLVKQTIESVE